MKAGRKGKRMEEGRIRNRERILEHKRKDIRSVGGEEKREVKVSDSTAAAGQHDTPVALMSHLLEIQRLPRADRGPSRPS